MKKSQFSYMFRLTVAPGVCEDERIDEAVAFCVKNHIDDVMLITCGEQLNTGHITPEEWVIWERLFNKVRERLAPHGITASINPWTTTLHCDRGRQRKPGQDFHRMVDQNGREASAIACPADEDFLDYVADMYRRYAEAHPDTLWLEDDMRLHNHAPLEWGGCFCDYHMKLFSEAIGHPVTREEFVAAITAEGEPHPYRKVWLDVARESICRLAERIAEAVFEVDPNIRLGLMCSAPTAHAIEGRDWKRLMTALTGNKTPYLRIHLPAYGEESNNFYNFMFTAISRQTAALAPAEVEIAPELENCNWTSFSKSTRFTGFQIHSATLLPSVGITMNIYDMMGNGVIDNRYDAMLCEAKPFAEQILSLGLRPDLTRGVAVPVFERSVYTLHSYQSGSMRGLSPRDGLFASLLAAFSVSHHYAANRLPESGLAALSGQSVRNYSDAELDRLFAENRVILDGEAVLALADRGRLSLIGARSAALAAIDEGDRAMEEFTVPLCGRDRMRMSVMDDAGDFVAVTYAPETARQTLARVVTPLGQPVLDTVTLVGENILVLPWANYPRDFAYRKCDALAELLRRFIGNRTVWTDRPYLNVYEYTTADGGRALALVNLSGDRYENIRLHGAEAYAGATLYTVKEPAGIPAPLTEADGVLCLNTALERLDVAVLKIN